MSENNLENPEPVVDGRMKNALDPGNSHVLSSDELETKFAKVTKEEKMKAQLKKRENQPQDGFEGGKSRRRRRKTKKKKTRKVKRKAKKTKNRRRKGKRKSKTRKH